MGKVAKEYTGTVYIGVVGPDNEIGECRDSIQDLIKRNGDEGPKFIRATKGYSARQMHLNNFIASKHDFILLLDHDQIFPPDALERLRSHKLPYVSGYYMRRRYQPILPVWYELGPRGKFPMTPWTNDPQTADLVSLGASGWGCVLIHRDVVMGVRQQLKGEAEILEDDMDIWPYDLRAILSAVRELGRLARAKPDVDIYPLLEEHVATLTREIRPLRVDKSDMIGSDIRFPFFAREAGYILMGDPAVRCGHALYYPLHPDDFGRMPPDGVDEIKTHIAKDVKDEARKLETLRRGLK